MTQKFPPECQASFITTTRKIMNFSSMAKRLISCFNLADITGPLASLDYPSR